jgi:ribosomal protein S27E
MATTFVIACPDCGKQVKVSEEHVGKKVKCKGCGTVYPVKAPGGAPAAARKGPPPTPGKAKATQAKVTKAAPPDEEEERAAPPPPADEPAAGYKYVDDDEEGPKQYTLAKTDDHLPRCPYCAKEMESAEARICLNCGYNTRTRVRPEVKQVYAHSFGEMFLWLLPGILTILLMIGELVFFIFFCMKIEGWLEDTWIEDAKGPPAEYIGGLGPPFMRVYLGLLIVGSYVPLVRFAWKRLVRNNKPPETKIKDDWEK